MAKHVRLQQDASASEALGELADWLALHRRLATATARLRGLLTEAGRGRFNETEQLVLWHCYLGPPEGLGQSELVAALGCSAAQVSGTVEKLRRQGQLRSRRCPRDRRCQRWSLTTAGQRTLAGWQEPMAAILAGLEAQLPGSLRVELSELLASLMAAGSPEEQATPAVPLAGESNVRGEAA